MHDPMTVAHEIRSPWKKKDGYRRSLVTIWHVDPETDGTDDSCDYAGMRPTLRPKERALFDQLEHMETYIGRDPFYSAHKDEVRALYSALYAWRAEPRRRFRWSPAWHVHHWRIVIEPWRRLRHRFDRCAVCGKRMGTATRIGNWGGDKVWHMGCEVSPPLLP